MTVHLHTAERTDALADGLADLLVNPAARIRSPARSSSCRRVAWSGGSPSACPTGWASAGAAVTVSAPGSTSSPPTPSSRCCSARTSDDPWDPDRLAWPLLGVIDDVMGTPGFDDLSTHLGRGDPTDDRSTRRYAVARRLAGLFSSYAVQRPELIAQWRSGLDTDGAGGDLDPDLRWQAELWRRLVGRVGAPPPDVRLADTMARLRAGGDDLDLPPRLSLFGHTRLPETEVALLRALGEVREVHLWLPQASPVLWDALEPTARAGQVARAADGSSRVVGHPLLSSLGRDSRELRRTLGVLPGAAVEAPPVAGDTLLGWLQHDLRANTAPDAAARSSRTTSDESVQVHACHGAARQVDVLREVLVGLLEDDPTLEPRDILGDVPRHRDLRTVDLGRLRDGRRRRRGSRPPRTPAQGATGRPVAGGHQPAPRRRLPAGRAGAWRMTASQVLDVAGAEPVRARFGFGDDELERITHWVDLAGIRWGYDADHRSTFGLGGVSANTWATGVRRVLLGRGDVRARPPAGRPAPCPSTT